MVEPGWNLMKGEFAVMEVGNQAFFPFGLEFSNPTKRILSPMPAGEIWIRSTNFMLPLYDHYLKRIQPGNVRPVTVSSRSVRNASADLWGLTQNSVPQSPSMTSVTGVRSFPSYPPSRALQHAKDDLRLSVELLFEMPT
jgi:hypothetical protein